MFIIVTSKGTGRDHCVNTDLIESYEEIINTYDEVLGTELHMASGERIKINERMGTINNETRARCAGYDQ